MTVECKIKEKIIKVNMELTELCKESSRVNAQLVPRFEEKLLITTLGVHFWDIRSWTRIFGEATFESEFQKANTKERFLEESY